nr:MAG TPA: hypothetical protein [Caudoviricetes sp.]
MRQRRAEFSAANWQRNFAPRKGQSKIGLSQKTDIPNFGEMCPVLDRSMRRRGAQKSIGQKCPKSPSGGEAVKNWLFRSSELYSDLSKRRVVNRHPLPVDVRICAA